MSTSQANRRPAAAVTLALLATLLAARDGTAFAESSAAANSAADGSGHRVYVTNEMSGELTVIDGATHQVIASIPLGKRPRGMQADPSARVLYVALSGSPIVPPGADDASAPPANKAADGIGVVDLATLRLVRVIRGVSDPEQLAVSRDGQLLYVASEDTGTLWVIDTRSGALITTLPVGGEPEGVTLSPDGRVVYVTSEADSIVSVVSTDTNAIVATVAVGKRPRFCAFLPDGSRAFVSGELDATLSVVDTHSHKLIHTVKIAGENVRPMGIAVAPDGKTIYLATGRGGTLVAINAKTFDLERTIAIGPRPWNVALSPDGSILYSANGPSNDVSIIDTKSMTLKAKVAVGEKPWGVIVLHAAKNRPPT